ncbi:MAG: hypothetical protein COY68_00465 [Candidatus Levybacteria bacterium CG_4_10_14_0_8_um_filter_35_23]|nr:MAG: hypothetical protein COY68_00465 [Candidatus Levybacteria bacterium CG_4_10_14_0_8_um_filter_35_23]
MKKISLVIIVVLFFLLPKQARAFTSAADTITTSRPSASAPLSANAATNDSSVTVVAGSANLSTFLASDAAKLWGGPPQEILTVASASADRTKIWFTSALTGNHSLGSMVTSAVTAKHTITFKLSQAAAINDVLKVTFPGATDNSASPSATTFAFNGLNGSSGTNLSVSGTTCSSWSVSSPNITCTLGGAVDTNTTVTITIGSSTPQLINPTKSQTIGTSDLWRIGLSHTSGGFDAEAPANVAIASIESVYVSGVVDASITMTIAGIANGVVVKDDNTGCNATGFAMTTNSGAASSPTSVNLGAIGTAINYAAQKISIATNGPNGYSLTATASGRLINPASGYWFTNAQGGLDLTANDTPIPAAIAGAVDAFGISACGTHAYTTNFGTTTAKFGNPSNSAGNAYTYKLASTTGATASVATSVVYGVSAAATTPAGTYSTILTYVATPTF